VREFWQLNADLFGATGVAADAEVIAMAYSLVKGFGADDSAFEIRVSDRRILDTIYDSIGVDADKRAEVTRLLDRRAKIDDFAGELEKLIGAGAPTLIDQLDRTTSTAYLEALRVELAHMGVNNMIVDTKITRGFDYYTGMVFEVFDTAEGNRRSMMGGGRYDNLSALFGGDPIPAVGFAMGDVVVRDFLETHNLLPAYAPATELMLCVIDESAMTHAQRLAQDLRREDVTVAVNISGKRIGDQVRQADKMKIPFVIAIGTQERDSGRYTIKNLATGTETTLAADRISEHLFSSLG
jgi:histidyl-tRNA synthetase